MIYSDSISVAHVDGSESTTTLAQLTGKHPTGHKSDYTIIYFYPKDCTSGCTVEAVEFSQLVDEFAALWAQVIGVSKDSITSHHKFITKSQLQVDLISDTDTTLHQAFGARWEKSMYWRKYMWSIRSTFILDTSGKIITKYDKVTARGHAKQVLDDLTRYISSL
jgi:peroxiredoxin Q/BCP